MPEYTQDTIEQLVDGRLPWPELRGMMSSFKDDGRFAAYVAALQQRVPWEDRIVLPQAGFDFGDYRRNWKLNAVIFERDTPELMNEVYPELMGADPQWMTLREYYCPLSYTLLEIEAVPPGYPIVHTFEPDLEGFYREWLGKAL